MAAKILSYSLAAWGQGVASEGNTGAQFVTLGAVLKTELHETTRHIANELVGNRLAVALGLPSPPGGLISLPRSLRPGEATQHSFGFASFRLGQTQSLPPASLKQIALDLPEMAGAIAAFDIWLANGDRHPHNVAYLKGKIPLMIFDHGGILGGESRQSLIVGNRLKLVPSEFNGYLTTAKHVDSWSAAIRQVPLKTIDAVLDDVSSAHLLSRKEVAAMSEWILERRVHLHELARKALPALTDWGLPL
jgi:hypothetical protein